MGYDFELAGRIETVLPAYGEDRIDLLIDGVRRRAVLHEGASPGEAILELDGRRERIWRARDGDVHYIQRAGRVHRIVAINALERAQREAAPSGGEEVLQAPMPGVVISIAVREGDDVARGDLLLTIESMKLETSVTAPRDGRIGEVCTRVGATFDQGEALVRLDALDDADDSDEESAS